MKYLNVGEHEKYSWPGVFNDERMNRNPKLIWCRWKYKVKCVFMISYQF